MKRAPDVVDSEVGALVSIDELDGDCGGSGLAVELVAGAGRGTVEIET